MHLECVSVCVGYADFLAETIPVNRGHFERWLIVTTPEDSATRDLCHRYNLECLTTRDFFRAAAQFDKARGVDHALALLSWRGWVLHQDADMALPGTFRESLENADLDPRCIYGADRFDVLGWERWQRLKGSGFLERYARCAHHNVCFPESFPVGARWADLHQGYAPIGAFQLFHADAVMSNGIRHRRYPNYGHNDAARTDMQFALQWDRRHRQLLPEVVAAHLESEQCPVGTNWAGRKTRPFGPPGPAGKPRPPCS